MQISPRQLLLSQRFNNKFSRLDLIVRYILLEAYYGDGDIDSDDYMAAKDKAIKKAMGKDVDEVAGDDEHMVHELIGDLFAPGNARSHLDFSVEAIAKALEDYKEDLTRQGVKDAMDLYDKLAADGTLDKEVEDGNGFISSKHVPKLKKAFELIGLYGKGINESVVKNNIKSIITKILEEEVINEVSKSIFKYLIIHLLEILQGLLIDQAGQFYLPF